MKIKITLDNIAISFFILSLTIHFAHAQKIVEKKNGGEKQISYFVASAGVSIPQENGLSNVNASAGPQVNLGYTTFFNKRWGMGLVVSGSIYKSEPVNEYSLYTGQNYYSTSPTQNWQKAESYISFSYTPILKKRWAIDVIQGFGFFYIKKPAYDYYSSYGNHKESSKKGWNTGYNICLVGRMLVSDNIGLFIKGNFFYNTGIIPNNTPANAFNAVDCQLGAVFSLKK